MIAVSRAPLGEIERYRKRMGWQFKWVSSFGNDFNYAFYCSSGDPELADAPTRSGAPVQSITPQPR